MRLLLICALRAAYFSSEPTRGSFGSMIMTVLNRRVCRCHWKSINTFDAGAPPCLPTSGCMLTTVFSGFGSRKAPAPFPVNVIS